MEKEKNESYLQIETNYEPQKPGQGYFAANADFKCLQRRIEQEAK